MQKFARQRLPRRRQRRGEGGGRVEQRLSVFGRIVKYETILRETVPCCVQKNTYTIELFGRRR